MAMERWRQEERERSNERLQALQVVEQNALLPVQQQARFLENVQKFVKNTLGPRLTEKEKKRLERVASRGFGYAYYHTVLSLSESHKLTPPGPAQQWERFREPRPKPDKAPES
jgi:hypothetical protein